MTIKLEPAYAWECPACRCKNFEMPVPAELLPSEAEELRETLGIPAGCGGAITVSPSVVECRECGLEFDCRAFDGCDDENCTACSSEYSVDGEFDFDDAEFSDEDDDEDGPYDSLLN